MKYKIGIIGLGYVGLPLAIEFSKKHKTVGFDIKTNRINDLIDCNDETGEISDIQLEKSNNLLFTSNIKDLIECNIYIISVPTPIDDEKKPNLKILFEATKSIGEILKKGDIVIFESTVYPGCTEEDCVPILEKKSGLKFNIDFYCGYSPERINPGDKDKTLTKIIKITSGSTVPIAKIIDDLYNSILENGTFPVSSIKVAEAAKIIENCQRDINIAFVNELSILFNLMEIDTQEVLDAAGSKWNFLPFTPGLVGGHCIGVDPYYLTYKAEKLGYDSKIILSGRKLNDSMPNYVYKRIENKFNDKKINLANSSILILGITFKENCTDSRNSKVVDIYKMFNDKSANVDVYDPYAIESDVLKHFNIKLSAYHYIKNKIYDCIVIGVPHNAFKDLDMQKLLKNQGIVFDIKGMFNGKYERL